MSRIPEFKEGMGSRLPAPKVRRRLPSTPTTLVNGIHADSMAEEDKKRHSFDGSKLQNGRVTATQNSIPPTCPPRLKKMGSQANTEAGIPKIPRPKESSGIPGFSSPSRTSPSSHSEVRKPLGRSVSEEKSDTSSSSQIRLQQSSTEDMKSGEYNSVSSSESCTKDAQKQHKSDERYIPQTRSSLVETIRSSLNKSSDELHESNVKKLSTYTGLTRAGFNTRGNASSLSKSSMGLSSSVPRDGTKYSSTEASNGDNSKPSKLRSRSYSKERGKSPSGSRIARVSSAERGRVSVRRQASRNTHVDSDSSECEPSAQPTRAPRSSLPLSQSSSSRKSSLPRHVASRRSMLSSSSSQSDSIPKRDITAQQKLSHSDKHTQDEFLEKDAVSKCPKNQDDQSETKKQLWHQKPGFCGSSDQIDSGINSSKDSDMPLPEAKVNRTSAGPVESFSVVKLTDSMLSVYEIQETDGAQNDKQSQSKLTCATTELCSNTTNKTKIVVEVSETDDSKCQTNDVEMDPGQTWSQTQNTRPRTYSGGSLLLPSETKEELEVEDALKSQQRHSWGDEHGSFVSNMPLTLNTWHGPDSDLSTVSNRHNLVSALDSSGMSYASSGDSESDRPTHDSTSQKGGQLKSYLSTQLSQAKTQSPTRRQITVQTQESKNDSKPPLRFTSRMRPNSPSTRSPLLPIKPQMIRRNSFKERALQERPTVKKSETRPRSPVLATQGDRNSIASDTSDSKITKESPRAGKIQSLASLFQGGKSRDEEFGLNSPRRTSSRESSPAQFSDDSAPPKIPPKLTSPRNRSPVLAFPFGRNKSPSGRTSKLSLPESESESDIAPALPPRRTSSPNTDSKESKKASSLPVSSRENSPGRKLFLGASKQSTKSRDNSPLSMLLSNNRKIQEANSMVFTPVPTSNTSSAPSTPTRETEENERVKFLAKQIERNHQDNEESEKELQPEASAGQNQNKSLSSRGNSPVRASHTASFIAKYRDGSKSYIKRSSLKDSQICNQVSLKEESDAATFDRPAPLYSSRHRTVGGSRGSSPVSEQSKIVPPRRPRSSPPVIVYKTPSDDEEVTQRSKQSSGSITNKPKSGLIPPRVTSPARSGSVTPKIGSPARGQSPSGGQPGSITSESKTGIKVLTKSSKLPFFMAQDKKPPLGRSISKESKASSDDSKGDSSFLLQVINRQDSVGDSDSSIGRESQSSRKKSGILKQASDDSDGSDYSYGKGGRDSPSKKRVTFDKHIMEKEAKRELRERRLKEELAKFVVERKKQLAVSKYSVDESGQNYDFNETRDSWDKSVASDFEDYFSGSPNEEKIRELEKYIMMARQQRENQMSEDSRSVESPLYSEIDKSKKSCRLNNQSQLDTSASDQELVFDEIENEVEGDYVKLSDLECVMRSNSRNQSPYLSDSSDRVQIVGETDLDHIDLDVDESDHQGKVPD